MRKGLIAATLATIGMLFSVAACGEKPAPTPSGSTYELEITNKAEMQAEWLSDDPARTLAFNVKKDGVTQNALQLVTKREMTITSSDTNVARVSGVNVSPVDGEGGTATITATYGDKTDSVTVTVTKADKHGKIESDPLTVAEALAICEQTGATATTIEYYISGVVTSISSAWSDQYGNISFLIGDKDAAADANKLTVYRAGVLKDKDGNELVDHTIISVGSEVLVKGFLITYSGTPEVNQGGTVLSATQGHVAQIIPATVAEALTACKALGQNESSADKYEVTGYVTGNNGEGAYLSDTKGEVTPTSMENLLAYWGDGKIPDDVTLNAKIKVTAFLKYYVSSSTAGKYAYELDAVGTNYEVLEPGVAPAQAIKVTVAEALAVAGALASGASTEDKYEVTGFIKLVDTAYNAGYHNITVSIVDDMNDTAVLQIFRLDLTNDDADAEAALAAKLKVGAKITVTGLLKNYSGTLEMTGAKDPVIVAEAPESTEVEVTDFDAVATEKTVAEVKAVTAEDKTVLAKVTGIAENQYGQAKYGNFYLTDVVNGETIVVYGGYKTIAYTQNSATHIFTAGTGSDPVATADTGKVVTVYGTLGVKNGVGQLVNAKVVVGDAYAGNVAASVTVNDAEMGEATLSATEVAYGAEVTVTPTPASGYQVKKVEINRGYKTEEIAAVEGAYKFNASGINKVTVTFEAVPTVNYQLAKSINVATATPSAYVNNYSSTFTLTSDGFVMSATGMNNGQSSSNWGHLRIGSKNGASEASIMTQAALTEAIAKVAINLSAVDSSIEASIKLQTSADGETWTDAGTFTYEAGEQAIVLETPTANLYYRVFFSCAKMGSNGNVRLTGVSFYTIQA